ncbi:MAG: hypothetical protein PHN98_09005 [Smithellaceae bacterium]|nr:hypothetical protein [Smithellaceae bacterium]
MLSVPRSRTERQFVFNRSFQKIVDYTNPDGKYVDPTRILNKDMRALEEIGKDAASFVPFFEVVILKGVAGDYFYQMDLCAGCDISLSNWKTIHTCLKDSLLVFEKERFGTQGRLFIDESDLSKKSDARQNRYERDLSLAQEIKDEYTEWKNILTKMVNEGATLADISQKCGLPVETVKLCLYSTISAKPTISTLALKIIENSAPAKELGMRNGNRIYDEIISRKNVRVFPKRVRYTKSKRIKEFPTDPVQLDKD